MRVNNRIDFPRLKEIRETIRLSESNWALLKDRKPIYLGDKGLEHGIKVLCVRHMTGETMSCVVHSVQPVLYNVELELKEVEDEDNRTI